MPPAPLDPLPAPLAAARDDLCRWLVRDAAPLWARAGVDAAGGFHEALDWTATPLPVPRRTRVTGRQIYSFAEAGRLGWDGPWEAIAARGLDYLAARVLLPDGTARRLTEADGSPRDDTFSLYDQAFALFGLAAAARLPALRARAEAAAVRLRAVLERDYRHPVQGFHEDRAGEKPLEANPHMHLLEVCLAWEEQGGDAGWAALADEIVDLALGRLIRDGWLREHFDAGWSPLPGLDGRRCEPGHHVEWAWLLVRWGLRRGRPAVFAAAADLARTAEAHGLCDGFLVMEVLDDGRMHDATARLWSQTERLKGHLALARVTAGAARAGHLACAAGAAAAMQAYLAVTPAGLWRDRRETDGRFRDEPVPASTFYHLAGAIAELAAAG